MPVGLVIGDMVLTAAVGLSDIRPGVLTVLEKEGWGRTGGFREFLLFGFLEDSCFVL